jgi:hypothetical protein
LRRLFRLVERPGGDSDTAWRRHSAGATPTIGLRPADGMPTERPRRAYIMPTSCQHQANIKPTQCLHDAYTISAQPVDIVITMSARPRTCRHLLTFLQFQRVMVLFFSHH